MNSGNYSDKAEEVFHYQYICSSSINKIKDWYKVISTLISMLLLLVIGNLQLLFLVQLKSIIILVLDCTVSSYTSIPTDISVCIVQHSLRS